MGRRKSYNREQVLSTAMRLFWERGFHAATTRELAAAMGVNVYSLYAEFGSKEGLFHAALERYDRTVVAGHFGRLEQPSAGLDAVREVLHFFGHTAPQDNPLLGCLSTNAMTERAPAGELGQQLGAAYTERLIGAFDNALENAVRSGELRTETPVPELSGFLAVVLIGVFVMLRAGGDPALMRDATDQALARVEAFAVGVEGPACGAGQSVKARQRDVQ